MGGAGRGKMGDGTWPITLADVHAARDRLAAYLRPTALRDYAPLDAAVGAEIRVLVKHENHQPTNSFKVRNGLAAVSALGADERRRGVITASRGNHGQGVAYAGRLLGVPVTVCVPHGNNPEKNEAMRGFAAKVLEEGRDYDAAVTLAGRRAQERGLTLLHGTNNRFVLAGAGTMTLEIVEDAPELDALVIAVGGGSQAVGALTVVRERRPGVQVFGVQAEGADAIYRSWKAGRPLSGERAETFADGIATRETYALTFPALCAGLADFVTVTDAEIAEALRLLLRTTHNLVEGAAAAGLAGLLKLRDRLPGRRVAIILTGGNIDQETLERVVTGRI